MSDSTNAPQPNRAARFADRLNRAPDVEEDAHTRFTEAALERHKREGMALAIRARFIALGVIAILLPIMNFDWEMLYFGVILIGFALIGWAQLRFAKVGRSRTEFLLMIADFVLITITVAAPNPLDTDSFPLAVNYRFSGFLYFFVFLAFGTLAYSWRTVWSIGVVASLLWAIGIALAWQFGATDPALTAATEAAFGDNPNLVDLLDPNDLLLFLRLQEVVIFLLVAGILAVTVRRFSRLLLGNAALERERENLARYFSPNVVEELSHNDEPLKTIRTQNVAVLFVDIVGFTTFAASRSSEEVIITLRDFHKRMEAEVFRHHGTLDKYLGDGLMATFGTPMAQEEDAANALRCARAMIAALADWNAARRAAGEPELQAGVGLHYGPAVLGNIGSNRLEFAVIGNTVNVASRVEALTRRLNCGLVATDDLIERAKVEMNGDAEVLDLTRRDGQEIRGLEKRVTLWTLGAAHGEAA